MKIFCKTKLSCMFVNIEKHRLFKEFNAQYYVGDRYDGGSAQKTLFTSKTYNGFYEQPISFFNAKEFNLTTQVYPTATETAVQVRLNLGTWQPTTYLISSRTHASKA